MYEYRQNVNVHSCKNEIWWKAIMHLQQLGKLKNVVSTLRKKRIETLWVFKVSEWWISLQMKSVEVALFHYSTRLTACRSIFICSLIFLNVLENKKLREYELYSLETWKTKQGSKKEKILQVMEKQSTHWVNKSRQKISKTKYPYS